MTIANLLLLWCMISILNSHRYRDTECRSADMVKTEAVWSWVHCTLFVCFDSALMESWPRINVVTTIVTTFKCYPMGKVGLPSARYTNGLRYGISQSQHLQPSMIPYENECVLLYSWQMNPRRSVPMLGDNLRAKSKLKSGNWHRTEFG